MLYVVSSWIVKQVLFYCDFGAEAGQSNSIDGQDILGSSKSHVNSDESSDEVDFESLGRIYSGAAASSSSSISKPESCSLAANPLLSSSFVDSFYKLRCECKLIHCCRSWVQTLGRVVQEHLPFTTYLLQM